MRNANKPRGPNSLAVLAILVLSAVLCGCQLAPTGSSDLNSSIPPAAPSASVSFCDTPSQGCSAASSFSASSLRDLNIFVNLANLPAGNHVEKINVSHPGGGLYQSFQNSFAIASGTDGSYTTINALPVAGTWIVQRSMLGDWQVAVQLDGQPIATQTVTLTQ